MTYYGPTGLIAQRFGTGSWQWMMKDHLGSARVVETSGDGFSGVLAPAWTEAILSVDLSDQERAAWAEKLTA